MKILQFPTESTTECVAALAEKRLRESPYFFLKRLTCHFDSGVLTLEGRVPSGRLRQFAESIVGRVEGVMEVVNQIDVVDPVHAPFTTPVRTAG